MIALRTLLLCILLSLKMALASAQLPDTVFLEDLTWTELKNQIHDGKTTIIVPIGGTEQNGPAMALGKHNVRVKTLAARIARTLGNALVAPVIAYVPEGKLNPPTEHMRFPGTITIPDDTFEKTLDAAARSLKLHGFRDIVFLGDHGGYQKNIKVVAQRLNRDWAKTPARAHALEEYYRASETSYVQALKSRSYRDSEIGTHAGLADTSLMLAVDPSVVRTNQLTADIDMDRAHGVYGDPRRASAELGQLGVNAIVTQTVEAIKKAVAHR
ncbi:MAG: creatininase family protein [Gammaproteobacteria bacterium]|nr:creatininase family protein [Gammaproteobacteria bacterium]